MTYADLIEWVSIDTGLTKKVSKEALESASTHIVKAVRRDGPFTWPRFGTFKLRTRRARVIRNPQTNELMRLGSTSSLGFSASKHTRKGPR